MNLRFGTIFDDVDSKDRQVPISDVVDLVARMRNLDNINNYSPNKSDFGSVIRLAQMKEADILRRLREVREELALARLNREMKSCSANCSSDHVNPVSLPDSRSATGNGTPSLRNKFHKVPELFKEYKQVVEQKLEQSIIRRVPEGVVFCTVQPPGQASDLRIPQLGPCCHDTVPDSLSQSANVSQLHIELASSDLPEAKESAVTVSSASEARVQIPTVEETTMNWPPCDMILPGITDIAATVSADVERAVLFDSQSGSVNLNSSLVQGVLYCVGVDGRIDVPSAFQSVSSIAVTFASDARASVAPICVPVMAMNNSSAMFDDLGVVVEARPLEALKSSEPKEDGTEALVEDDEPVIGLKDPSVCSIDSIGVKLNSRPLAESSPSLGGMDLELGFPVDRLMPAGCGTHHLCAAILQDLGVVSSHLGGQNNSLLDLSVSDTAILNRTSSSEETCSLWESHCNELEWFVPVVAAVGEAARLCSGRDTFTLELSGSRKRLILFYFCEAGKVLCSGEYAFVDIHLDKSAVVAAGAAASTSMLVGPSGASTVSAFTLDGRSGYVVQIVCDRGVVYYPITEDLSFQGSEKPAGADSADLLPFDPGGS